MSEKGHASFDSVVDDFEGSAGEKRKYCKDCSQYSRKTKMCNSVKFVPRMGSCLSWISGKR